jgi:hypothetical protein
MKEIATGHLCSLCSRTSASKRFYSIGFKEKDGESDRYATQIGLMGGAPGLDEI